MNKPDAGSPHKVKLNNDAADQILANVFEFCDQQPNSTSLEQIKAQKKQRRLLTALCWILGILLVLAVLILPVVLANPKVEVSWLEGTPAGSPVLQISTSGLIPVDSITARIDDTEQKVHEVAEQLYYLYPDRNGRLTLTVTLGNRKTTEAEVEVVGVDHVPPQMVGSQLLDGELEIHFHDEDSAIDYDSIYAMDMNGVKILPLSCNKGNMSATFAFPDNSLNIFVSDTCGNTLQLVLTVGTKPVEE